MSGNNEIIRTIKKKINDIPETSLKKKMIFHNKLLNSNNDIYKKEIEDNNFLCEFSSELLNENIKLSSIKSPFINPIPCFQVKNDNSKKQIIKKKGTFSKNLKTQVNFLNNLEINTNNINDIDNNTDIDKSEKTKILSKNLKKSHINNRYHRRPHSPNFETKDNKIFKSQNFEFVNVNNNMHTNSNINTNINSNEAHSQLLFNNKNQINRNINRNKLNNSKPLLSCRKKNKTKSHLYYSTDNFLGIPYIYDDKKIKEIEEKKNKIKILKQLGQKINVAMMKIELLQNYKNDKNRKMIKKRIEYNKIYCNNDLQRLKDNYYNKINQHFNQIKYLKMRLLKCEEKFLTINKHKDIISKEELDFKIKKMNIIEKIILLQKRLHDFKHPSTTVNDTHHLDDSFEDQTIKDVSFNDYSIIKDTIGVNYSYNFNKAYFSEEPLYENKIIKIKPNEINMFTAKFIDSMKIKKYKNKINN